MYAGMKVEAYIIVNEYAKRQRSNVPSQRNTTRSQCEATKRNSNAANSTVTNVGRMVITAVDNAGIARACNTLARINSLFALHA